MSPLNRGPLLGPRMPPAGMRPRFGGRLPMPGMPPRMPPPMGPMFGPMRQRMMPPRPGGIMRPGGPPPLFVPRGRGVPPLMPPMMHPRGMGPRGPPMRPGLRGPLPPQGLPHMRPRFPMGNGNITSKAINNAKKVSKLEELEMKKPWMTDEIRGEIQKKNKLYAKAKKNKDAKEWNEFKDLRNKVTRMIRDAKNEYLTKNPEQAHIYQDDNEPYDQRDENYVSSEDDETSHYCEVCDRDFNTAELLDKHIESHKTCGIDGCTFSAHPKLVEKHISMQHCTGLYRRMKNLSTPEDIENWIAERKKKYPTKINVEQKKAQESEKRERGELIRKSHCVPETRPKERSIREKKRKVRRRKVPEFKAEPDSLTVECYRGLRPFPGTSNLLRDVNNATEDEKTESLECCTETESVPTQDIADNISDEEEPVNSLECCKSSLECPETPATPAKIGSLVADYDSDSSDDEGPEEVPIKIMRTDAPLEENSPRLDDELPIVESTRNSPLKIQDDSKARVEKPAKSTNTRTRQSHERPNDKTPRNAATGYGNKKRLLLLQRLLSRSIQHERNIICQCIKYIADNNFFDTKL